jgi:hypothetical protein
MSAQRQVSDWTPYIAAPGDEPQRSMVVLPVSRPYYLAIMAMLSRAPCRASTAMVPPLPVLATGYIRSLVAASALIRVAPYTPSARLI